MEYKALLDTKNKSPWRNLRNYIILHHTATKEGSIQGVLKTLTVSTGDKAVSCHYVVDTNGDVYKIGQDSDILWHAGISSWENKNHMNLYSIGIEIIWPLSNGGFTDEQRKSVKELCLILMAKYKIPQKNVIRHKDVSPGRKVDVADTFWNGQFATFQDYQKSLVETPQETEAEKMVREFADKYWIRKRGNNESFSCFEILSILARMEK